MDEKQCPHCGEWIPEELGFCPYCMNKLTEEQVQQSHKKTLRWKWVLLWGAAGVLFITAILWNRSQAEPYADYMGTWQGEKGQVAVELKIEEVKDRVVYAYMIMTEGENELLRTDLNGSIDEAGCVLTGYDTGHETGRVRLELQNDRIEISAYQTEADEMSLWSFGRLPVLYLERSE